MTYTLEQAQSNLAQLLAEAEQGKDVVIEREGKPAIRLGVTEVAALPGSPKRELGLYRGLVQFDDSVFDPLTDEELVEYGFGFMLDKPLLSEEARDNQVG